jgi:hypothetical protein
MLKFVQMKYKIGSFRTEKASIPSKENLSDPSLSFIASGIACHALNLIDRAGILQTIQNQGSFDVRALNDSKFFKHPAAIKAALLSLANAGVMEKEGNTYSLTSLGQNLCNRIGLIRMLYDGYGELMAHSSNIALGKVKKPEHFMNHKAIAEASIQFGEELDHQLIDVVQKLRPKGTICDLGCGTGDKLLKICNATGKPGLGIDIDDDAFTTAKELSSSISLEKGDVTALEGIWEDIDIVLQTFVTHDFNPEEKCISSLASYKKNFPHMKYLIVVDIVAPDDRSSTFMPGYDYVHGLLGIEIRSFEKTTSLFTRAGYEVFKELPVASLPNTFIWVLKPRA